MDVCTYLYNVEINVNEQNFMRLGGFIEKIHTMAFGFLILCSLQVISKGLGL